VNRSADEVEARTISRRDNPMHVANLEDNMVLYDEKCGNQRSKTGSRAKGGTTSKIRSDLDEVQIDSEYHK
jgi:hypothetical protein